MGLNVELGNVPPPSMTVDSFSGDTEAEKDATAIIRGLAGWHIAESVIETDVVLDSDGGRILSLPTLMLTSVESVTDRDGNAVTDFRKSARGMLSRDCGWPQGFEAVTVSFTHGYATVPAELAALCRSMAKHISADPELAPVSSFTKVQGRKTLTKQFAVANSAALVGTLSLVERLVLNRYALGSLP